MKKQKYVFLLSDGGASISTEKLTPAQADEAYGEIDAIDYLPADQALNMALAIIRLTTSHD